jgi:hypothetical protein
MLGGYFSLQYINGQYRVQLKDIGEDYFPWRVLGEYAKCFLFLNPRNCNPSQLAKILTH